MALEPVIGFLEIYDKGFGFLRDIRKNFEPTPQDTYVPAVLIKKLNLKEGLLIEGLGRPGGPRQMNLKLDRVEKINNSNFLDYAGVKPFYEQVSVDPCQRFQLAQGADDTIGKALDLIVPMGKGQRGLIVAPPKSGKTMLLKHIAASIIQNHPDVVLFVLLVDERPEEVTDFQRELENAFVLSSSSDQGIHQHIRITRLTMNTAMGCAETGYDAVVLIDSLTRMSRAFNTDTDSGGKTLTGGLGANAMEVPRRYFGAARKLEGKGSLTNVATILVDTGSRMDDIIFQEFKGTGNMDLVLSRECAEKRIWPAINIHQSGTRKEHLLLDAKQHREIIDIRRGLSRMDETGAMAAFLEIIRDQKTT
jgi:transcription termination factor Rho